MRLQLRIPGHTRKRAWFLITRIWRGGRDHWYKLGYNPEDYARLLSAEN